MVAVSFVQKCKQVGLVVGVAYVEQRLVLVHVGGMH